MSRSFDPFRFLLIAVAGWMNQEQRQIVDYLREGNRPAYDGSVRRASGRPGMPAELAALVVRMASENRKLGLAEDTSALSNLGHSVARGTIAKIL